MIRICQTYKSFGDRLAIENVSLDIAPGEHVILLGPSGSGKTTLLRMINGLVTPSSGSVKVNDAAVHGQSLHKLRRQIGYVLQRNSLFPHYTVEENIGVVPRLLKWDQRAIRRRVRELMEKLHLPEAYRSRRPDELSGGEAQRVNIARALAADPPILLMDEPFSALDTLTRKSIRAEFTQLDEFRKKTIVMVTHDIQEAFELGDTVALLHNGKLIQHGKPQELLYNPTDDFVNGFLSNDYLKLSLSLTAIDDLWDYLPIGNGNEEGSAHPVGDTTLWEAMEAFRGKKRDGFITLRREQSDEWKRITWNQLMDAYRLLQNHNRR